MSKTTVLNKKFLLMVAGVVAAALLLSMIAGGLFGNRKSGAKQPDPTNTNTATNTTNTGDNTNTGGNGGEGGNTGGNGGNTQPTGKTTGNAAADEQIKKAATMQDYTIDPTTGMAKEIKVVDDNYLLLVNRTHPLAEAYAPADMVKVEKVVQGVGKPGETDYLRPVAAEAFAKMVEAAEADGIKILMRTGYRSFEYQRDRLYNPYVQTEMNNGLSEEKARAKADTFSARPGQSEHQTGLALDVGGESQGYALSYEFGNTAEGKWVAEHCHEYGFIIRYTDGTTEKAGDTTGFIFEPWHLRYVGVDSATVIKNNGELLEDFLGIIN